MKLHHPSILKMPMIFLLVAMRISIAITGTATSALRTADHIKAFTALIEKMFTAAPIRVATPIAA